MLRIQFLAVLGLLTAPLWAATAAGPVPRLPVETFFNKPAISSISFSPDGKRIACRIPYEHRLNLAVIDLESGKKQLITNFKDKEVGSIFWASNDRLLFQIDIDGEEAPGVYAVDRDGSNPVVLVKGGREGGGLNWRFGGLLRRLENDPKNVLVLSYEKQVSLPDVARMNLRSGAITVVTPNREGISGWLLDRNNEARIGISQAENRYRVLHRPPGSTGDWLELENTPLDDSTWTPIGFDGDNRTLYVAARRDSARYAVYRYDTVTREWSGPVVSDPVYDVGFDYLGSLTAMHYSRHLKRYVGLTYQADKPKTVFWDESYARRQKIVDKALPDTSNELLEESEDGVHFVYFAHSDRDPGVYYLFDDVKKRIDELAVLWPKIEPEKMAPMTPIKFKSRDGVLLHGYLTLPVGVAPTNLPLVINPHGGPYGIRDVWGFSPEVQLLANRGFAVLQVNYRGSSGYGPDFERIGWKKWGLEMQNDLSDAVKWAVDQGLADPKRVLICGASYGGYASMAGLAFTPELYCAGINYVGVTDISLLVGQQGNPQALHWRWTRIGNPSDGDDRARIKATSPVNFADKIRAPVLMAYGKNDPRVVMAHGWDMERGLKAAGKDYKLLIEKDEGHGFRKEENSIAFYSEVDAFLDRVVPRKGERVSVGESKVMELPAKP